ncbi:MAG: 30S ribosomal protein S6 [Planctomycetes bacterium]|nr:30S ribosomal protein S6 [Planctomycetota bacterium]
MADDGKRLYEGLFLVDSGFANKEPEAAVELCKGVLEKHGATVIRCELWSETRLAYEVRKNKRGAYLLAAFRADTMKMGEIELECRLTERIVRYQFLNREGIPMEKWYRRYEISQRPPRREADAVETESIETEEAAAS